MPRPAHSNTAAATNNYLQRDQSSACHLIQKCCHFLEVALLQVDGPSFWPGREHVRSVESACKHGQLAVLHCVLCGSHESRDDEFIHLSSFPADRKSVV